MLEWYQHLPGLIDPVVFRIGDVAVRWYGVLYVGAFIACGAALWQLVRREHVEVPGEKVADLCLWMFYGAVIGGRLGFVFFYGWTFFSVHPLAILWPFGLYDGIWLGWTGMSYFGGLMGAVAGLAWFVRRNNWFFWEWADRIALIAPLGYFLGRIANFLNGELYGRVTQRSWGMHFPHDSSHGAVLRHPSALYESLGEGMCLLLVLWLLRKRFVYSGQLAAFSIIGYAIVRFFLEYFREPDPQIGFIAGLTLGQWLSIAAFFIGAIVFQWLKKRNVLI